MILSGFFAIDIPVSDALQQLTQTLMISFFATAEVRRTEVFWQTAVFCHEGERLLPLRLRTAPGPSAASRASAPAAAT